MSGPRIVHGDTGDPVADQIVRLTGLIYDDLIPELGADVALNVMFSAAVTVAARLGASADDVADQLRVVADQVPGLFAQLELANRAAAGHS